MKSKRALANRIFSGVGLALGAVILIGLVLYVRKTVSLGELLTAMRPAWLVAGILCVPISQSADALTFYFMGCRIGCPVRLPACFDIAFIGEFYYKLGPAGAPVQIKLMLDAGFTGTKTASVFVWKMVANMVVYTVYAIAALLLRGLIYHEGIAAAALWGVGILIALYLVVSAFALFCAVRPAPVQRFARLLLTKLSKKIRPLAKSGRIDRLMVRLGDVCDQLNACRGDKFLLFGLFFGMFIELGVLFAIPCCVYYGLGLSGEVFASLLFTQSLVMLLARIVVLPGNVGGAEGSFFLFMSTAFGAMMPVGLVLWRMMSFVETMALGAVWSVGRFAHRYVRGRR